MGRVIAITNLDHSASDLRRLMSKRKDGANAGRPMVPLLNEVQLAALKNLVVRGPRSRTNAVIRRRCINPRDEIEQRIQVKVHKRTVAM